MRKSLFLLFLFTFWGLRLSAIEPPALPFAYVTYSDDTLYDLHVMDAATGEEIYSVTTSGFDCPLSISPDGHWLVYSSGDSSGSTHQIFLVDLETNSERLLELNGVSPWTYLKWSSDSSAFALKNFERENREDALYVYDMPTHTMQTIATFPFTVRPNTFHWVENNLIYVMDNEDTIMIHSWQNGNDNNLSSVTLPKGNNTWKSLSPDGRWYATVLNSASSNGSLYIFNVATGDYDYIDELSNLDFIWKPDSTQLIYKNSVGDIYFYTPNTQSSQKIIANDSTLYNFIEWSPSGRYLTYESDYTIMNSLHVLEFTDGNLADKVGILKYDIAREWGWMKWLSPTKLIYTDSSRWIGRDPSIKHISNIWLYDVETREKTQLTDTPDLDEKLGCAWG